MSTQGYIENPSAALESYFERVFVNSMSDLKLVNRKVKVAAVGFHEYEGHWLGIMITPWFLNLMLLPKSGSPWPELVEQKGNDIALSFACGSLKFSPRIDPQLGSHLVCSLASPMDDFNSHEHALQTAEEILTALNKIPLLEVPPEQPENASRRALFRGEILTGSSALATGFDPQADFSAAKCSSGR